uniref:Claspin n=1 Tax=Caenorhabditis tropicalis TaxID=1561998 RepID=A0A1I7TAZ8_9PELO
MSEDCSPKRLPVRVRSTFELATPIKELPPDPNAVAMSPNTLRQKEKEMDDLLKNAKCEEGTSMDSIATYIPSKATLKRREEEAARVKAEEAAVRAAKKAAKIAAFEAELAKLRRDSYDDSLLDGEDIGNLSITLPTTVSAQEIGGVQEQGTPSQLWAASLSSSDGITVVSSPTIGALAAAPPAIGALMGAPPKVGAMVAAALQPAKTPSIECVDADDSSLGEDFQIVHDEYKQALAMEKAAKK